MDRKKVWESKIKLSKEKRNEKGTSRGPEKWTREGGTGVGDWKKGLTYLLKVGDCIKGLG